MELFPLAGSYDCAFLTQAKEVKILFCFQYELFRVHPHQSINEEPRLQQTVNPKERLNSDVPQNLHLTPAANGQELSDKRTDSLTHHPSHPILSNLGTLLAQAGGGGGGGGGG